MTPSLAGLTRRHLTPLATLTLATLALVFGFQGASAQTPAAGTSIGNQASATYLDASNTPRTATSNLVTTIVQQVASFTLTANGVRTAAPGGQAIFPHTLTNTGNGVDDFTLAAVNLGGDDFDAAPLTLYADADGNGVPDNFVALASTGPLAAGASFRFVAVAGVPGAQVGGDQGLVRVNAASTFDGAQTAFNNDQINVTGNAVISVTKAISAPSGNSPSGPYTYTLTYTNTGNRAATGLLLTDLIPAGMTYVAGSGQWSVTGAAVLTDADNADAQGVAPNQIIYDFGVTGAGVTANISQVPVGATGTLTFQVTVNAGLAPQVINNSATYAYNDGVANVGPFTTNTAAFTVNRNVSLTFTGQTLASATQGATLAFSNTLTNNGNGTDRFNVVVGASSFPVGTTYALYQSDGVTPLTDTNSDGIPDTGPIAAGASTAVVLQVQLPTGATGGAYQVQKTATSVADPLASATATDILTTIIANVVDVTNNAAGGAAPGAGPGPEGAAVITNTTNPGTTTRFTLYVNNNSTVSDAFGLAASTDPTFVTLALPAGWTVTFYDAGNTVITNTASILGGGNQLVYADVTVPAGAAPAVTQLYFRALSPTSGASDRIHDAVSVSPVRALTLVPNGSAQVAPGGVVVYTHLLANNGNVTEGNGVGSFTGLAMANNQVGWSSNLFWDTNASGVLDAGDVAIADLSAIGGLAPGASVRLFVQVFAPAGAPLGQVNVTTLTATTVNLGYTSPAPAPVSSTDASTVINGQVVITKEQALDADCNGTEDAAFGVVNLSSLPGGCIRYQITITNNGTADVTNVVVSDATPPNTTYTDTVPASTTVGTLTTPPGGASGTISVNVGVLGPGQSAVVTFGVRINP